MNRLLRCLLLFSLILPWTVTDVTANELPFISFNLHNPRDVAAHEIARVSLPVPRGMMSEVPQWVYAGSRRIPAQATVITRHTDGTARRVMLSFPVRLAAKTSARYTYRPGDAGDKDSPLARLTDTGAVITGEPWTLRAADERLEITTPDGTVTAVVEAFGPDVGQARPAEWTVIDNGPFFTWLRWRQDGTDYSREVDIQADSFGRLQLSQRVLRHLPENGWTPDLGFILTAPGAAPLQLPHEPLHFLSRPLREAFTEHPDLLAAVQLADGTAVSMANALALRQRRGTLAGDVTPDGLTVRFSRIEPVAQEMQGLQLQEGMWREIVVRLQPGQAQQLALELDQPLAAQADWRAYDAVYRTGPPLQVHHPVLQRFVEKYVSAIESLSMRGDDWGSLGGLERYNHCQYIWEDVFRTGDPRLRRVALDYTDNYNNFSIYWGPNPAFYGGGRYPANANTQPWPGTFRTRHNNAVSFCTKGYNGFWLAYEETGDPRYRYAAKKQAEWAAKHVTAGLNYTRCIGQVTDFVKLYEYTDRRAYLEQANRLWDEFKAVQTPDLLFTESGRPATGNDLYVPDDRFAAQHPFVKAYITQYAVNSLPQLLAHQPEDTHLRDTIIACSDWLAQVQTSGGGWSYPGPTTAGFNWNIEYCHGLMTGYDVNPSEQYLDCIQRDLRALVTLFDIYDAIVSGVTPWETLAGMNTQQLGEKYHLGTDRDRSRDFTDGQIRFGHVPDSTVYLQVLLRDYLSHRPESSLFTDDPILDRIVRLPAAIAEGAGQTGNPSLRIALATAETAQGAGIRLSAEAVYRLSGKEPSWEWILPDGSRLQGREVTWLCRRGGTFDIVLSAVESGVEYTRRVTVAVPAGPWDIGLAQWPAGIRVQAEDFAAQGGAEPVAQIRTVVEKLGSDGGSISHTDPLHLWQEWPVEIPQAGLYYLLVRYATPAPAQRLLTLGERELGTMTLAATGGYGSATADNWRSELLRNADGTALAVEIGAGRHTLRVTNVDGRGCNLDYLELLPASPAAGAPGG